MKHFKTFESFVNEKNEYLNEADNMANVRDYFPNKNNPAEYIGDKITSYSEKVALSAVLSDMFVELKVKDADKKVFSDAIKNYIKNFDVTGKLRKALNMNESDEVNEGNTSLGSKAKQFDSIEDQWDWFTDADGGEEKLPKEWQDALKKLSLKADDAIVCFFDAVGDAQAVRNAAKKAGVKYIEVSGDGDDDAGSGGIVFSGKQ